MCLVEYDFEVVVDGGGLLASSSDLRRANCGNEDDYDCLLDSGRDVGESGDIREGLGPLALVGVAGGRTLLAPD